MSRIEGAIAPAVAILYRQQRENALGLECISGRGFFYVCIPIRSDFRVCSGWACEQTKMAMDNVFHPGIRKWISSSFCLEEKAKSLQTLRDEFMAPVHSLRPLHRTRATSKYIPSDGLALFKMDELKKDLIKATLFGPKKRGRPKKKKEPCRCGEDSHLETYNDKIQECASDDSDVDGFDTYSDEEEEDQEPSAVKKLSSKKFQPSDEMYIFDSAGSDKSEGEDEENVIHSPFDENFGNETINEEPSTSAAVKTEITKTPEEAEAAVPGLASSSDTLEKDNKEFKLFYDYANAHGASVARRSLLADRPYMIKFLMNTYHITVKLAEEKYDALAEEINPHLAMAPRSEVIMEDALIKGSDMPILAGPIPNTALQTQATLAIYAGLSEEPGNFQWRMGHVAELLTTQAKGNLGFLRQEGLEKPWQKKRAFQRNEVILSVSMYQPWEETEAILTELKTIPEPDFGFELEILGSQTIEDLCSMFRCQADLVCTKDFEYPDLSESSSEAITSCNEYLTKTVTPWRAIFIHDTIYVNFDPAHEDQIHCIQALQDWAKRHKKEEGIGEFKFLNKMDTKLSDLRLQMGYPYVYIHQSINCEHLFCFSSMRIPRRVENSVFPSFTRVGKFPTKYCVADNELLARWAVVGCNRLPQDPMFLCTDCVKSYCYSRKVGQSRVRVGTFHLYPYFQLIHHIH